MTAWSRTVVAVDGPAGSGKSSVSRAAARELEFAFLDTGAAYRALAWLALERRVPLDDGAAIFALLGHWNYRISTDPDQVQVWVEGTEVTGLIRETRVSSVVSSVARVPEVRKALGQHFRLILNESGAAGVIAEGRDITTVVAPDADVRVLLTASEEVRLARRAGELGSVSAADLAAQVTERDRRDSQVVDFMTAADGVTTIDSSDLTFDETVQALVGLVKALTR